MYSEKLFALVEKGRRYKGVGMWKAEIKNGTLYLEGKKVPLVSKLTLEKNSKNTAALNLSMMVEIKDEIELTPELLWTLSLSGREGY